MKPGKSAVFATLFSLAALPAVSTAAAPAPANCKATVYLSFDTGSQSQAGLIADTLRRHRIKATFFLANEKTVNGDYSLDQTWAPYWKQLVQDGHAFGTHTFDHVYLSRDLPDGRIEVKPQFGAQAGKKLVWTAQQYCDELRRVDQRFTQLTGSKLDPYWRAPGGKLSPNLQKAALACGYAHAGWAPAGFSGDELPSESWSNPALLKRALDGLKDGDIFMAHLGIWSRKTPWAPENLEPLLTGLEQKGFCFASLREHPLYSVKKHP
ncbi:polysaccharide deacetylase family protein [Undibacterium piscinae]|uniref:Polysaccharide deacetylase family protein n=1 Tax=Undibacterium piscinae TaxID=2495591 RepID=A0A6M3ZZX6_9BURK|nr:polysaccharide deacetylase family protein [Undibacterium piscinae]